MTDNQIEQEIQAKGLTAPRITPADIEANIVHTEIVKHVSQSGQVLRWAVLTARNGFAVTGQPSASVSAENDRAEIGEQVAIDNARSELWTLMGYELKSKLANQSNQMERIARVCHEVNRAYCQALGDMSQPTWADAPEWQRSSARMGVDLHTMGDFGPEASHISWMQQKQDEGWVYGPVKDAEKKEHPCMVPFDQLPREQQAKDFIFRAVVHAMSKVA